MRIIYWIYTRHGWKKTNAETYYAYTGSKKITSGMGFGFELITNWLIRYR